MSAIECANTQIGRAVAANNLPAFSGLMAAPKTPYEFITIYKESAHNEATADCEALKAEQSD